MRGFHGCFPDLAFLLLAIAHDAKCFGRTSIHLLRQSHAYGEAQSLTQRSGGNFNSRQFHAMRMPLEGRTQFAQRHHVFLIEVAGECQARVERWGFVSGRPDNAITHLPVGILGIVVCTAEIQRRGNVHDRKRSAGVA